MKTTAEKIAVMQAEVEGKPIQRKWTHPGSRDCEWQDIAGVGAEPLWDWPNFDYRVKPESRRFWVTTVTGQWAFGPSPADKHYRVVHTSKKDADEWGSRNHCLQYETIEVVEVVK